MPKTENDIYKKIIKNIDKVDKADPFLEAAEEFLTANPVIYCMEEKCFYAYNGKFYHKCFNEDIQALLIKDNWIKLLSNSRRNLIMENISILARKNFSEINSEDAICLNNGLFYPKENKLEIHSPYKIITICIPYNFIQEAVCPLWEKSLEEIFEKNHNKIKILQEFMGYCLTKDTHLEKSLMLIGEGRNGKSTILHVLEHMVGENNCSVLPIKFLNDARMAHILLGKYVNINTEFSNKSDDFEEDFKRIVSGEPIQANPKYANEFKFRPFCKMIFSVNSMPHIDDKSQAFYSRLLILNFDRVFKEEEQNRDLKKELEKELPGILNWARVGLKRLYDRKDFIIDEYMKRTINDLKSFNNPIAGFIEDCVSIVNDKYTLKNEVYKEYKNWCVEHGFKSYGANKFGNEFYRLLKDYTKKDERETFAKQSRIWKNIVLKDSYNAQVDAGWTE